VEPSGNETSKSVGGTTVACGCAFGRTSTATPKPDMNVAVKPIKIRSRNPDRVPKPEKAVLIRVVGEIFMRY
jgi:hypothetical protein